MERIRLLDLARGFTVLFIPAIHTGMLYSTISVHHTLLGQFLIFIAEGPGGQLLMLLMGLSFTLKKHHSNQVVFVKALGLMVMGYLLNLLKFVVPYSLHGLPEAVVTELKATGNSTVWQLAGVGDILHFSGLALPLLHILYKRRHFHRVAFLLSVGIVCISPLLWYAESSNSVLNYVLQLAVGQPPRVFFPLFPWLVYPFIGLVIGYYFKQNRYQTILLCGIAGMLLLLTGLMIDKWFPVHFTAGFYRTPPAATCWHIGMVLMTLYVWYQIDKRLPENFFFRLLRYSSRNITVLYIIQWVMICWMLPVFGFRALDTWTSAIVMLSMTINTYLICYALQLIKRNYYGQSKNI